MYPITASEEVAIIKGARRRVRSDSMATMTTSMNATA